MPVLFKKNKKKRLGVGEAVEDAVDEGWGVAVAVSFGQFNGLVDGDVVGGVKKKDLKGSEAKDVSVGHRHPPQFPVFGCGGELFVDLRQVLLGAFQQLLSKFVDVADVVKAISYELLDVFRRLLRIGILLVEDLKHNFPGTGSQGHGVTPRLDH